MTQIPTSPPLKIITGTSYLWHNSFSNYKASEGWELEYQIFDNEQNLITTLAFDSEVTAIDNGFQITLAAATTAAYEQKILFYNAKISKASEVKTVSEGFFEVAKVNGSFARIAYLQKTISAIETLLEGKALNDAQNYSIGSRNLTKYSIKELLEWRDKYRAEYSRHLNQQAVSSGKKSNRNIKIQFGNI